MRLYSEASQEALDARRQLRAWLAKGSITAAQLATMQQDLFEETAHSKPLQSTNLFLRGVLAFFTMLGVSFFFSIFMVGSTHRSTGVTFLVVGALAYLGAEILVAQTGFYRHGVEEGLVVSAVVWGYAGLQTLCGSPSGSVRALLLGAAAIACLWIWYRFSLWYFFPVAMLSSALLPSHWTGSHAGQLLWIAAIFSGGIAAVAAVRLWQRPGYAARAFVLAEALLWLGLYVDLNLKLSLQILPRTAFFGVPVQSAPVYPSWFYWGTWLFVWCLPALLLFRGIRQKQRILLDAGIVMALLTFLSNKPYLGWPRHSWDPIVLGILLTGVAIWLRRWFSRGKAGDRGGFTAAWLSSDEKHLRDQGTTLVSWLSPWSTTTTTAPAAPDDRFGGGSGGGGASGTF